MPARDPRRLAALLAAGTLVAACAINPPSPTPGPTEDVLSIYRDIADDVASLRDLEDEDHSDPAIIDRETLRANLEAEFEESNPPEQLELGNRIYHALGLIPADKNLGDLVVDLQSSQVIGYYDPSVDELFLVSGTGQLGPTERVTYAHEFTHELQDGAFDLESLGLEEASLDDSDRAFAILSLVEGDAVTVQTVWMAQNLTPDELAQVAAEASDPAMLDILARTPAILLETSLFPYQAGASFVQALLGQQGGYDPVNEAYDNLPESTEQILHPEKYLAGEAPIDVELPEDLASTLGEGWTLDAEDTLGELQLRVWLREGGLPGDVAREAAAGWGGDRLGLLGGPDGDALMVISEWDSRADADEFARAAETALGPNGRQVRLGTTVAMLIGAPQIDELELLGLVGAFIEG